MSKLDYQKEWEKARKQLTDFSKEALTLAQKGERELIKFSKKGKLHLDSTAINLKREQLYLRIGKEYVKAKCPTEPTTKLKQLLKEHNSIDRELKKVQSKIKKSK